ncbi:YolD-like family protein [Mechercharimyces sp. CAU 1602]|uniref:YolD-like family protein n=1 Tax=Mechercharimyces sp. CAU 1602 TaxID=2973933 RepID=UPI0021624100|nr:YolD-like family protein [Mechercharimyces sp. CAU 1602]MCS1350746.1 YolD-like family protein [Mechercharimyces sp. CAU 1602]
MDRILDRGNKMWEGHRMVLPEHIASFHEQNRKAKECVKPELSEDAITEIGYIIEKSMINRCPVVISCADRYGIEQDRGVITKINANERWIKLQSEEDYELISFQRIVSVVEV